MKIGIFTGGTSVRSKNIFTDISRYPTGKHEIKCRSKFFSPLLHSLVNLVYRIVAQVLISSHQQQTAFENIVGKEEIARNEQFLLFPQCFLFKQKIVSPFVNVFDIISLFAAEFEEPKNGISGKGLNICGKREKCWKAVFCPFLNNVFYLIKEKSHHLIYYVSSANPLNLVKSKAV